MSHALDQHNANSAIRMAAPAPQPRDIMHIGIEWELQATLLEHPGKSVYFHGDPLLTRSGKECVFISIPQTVMGCAHMDCGNLEFISNPVPFADLAAEIRRVDGTIGPVAEWLAGEYGPIGFFFPQSRLHYPHGDPSPAVVSWSPSKHVNLSVSPRFLKPRLASHTTLRAAQVAAATHDQEPFRWHLRVPYGFSDYESLIREMEDDDEEGALLSDLPADTKPRLIGYCRGGGAPYIRVRGLI